MNVLSVVKCIQCAVVVTASQRPCMALAHVFIDIRFEINLNM